MKILVVEDEHLIANSIKKGLEMEKYTADVAYDGESGYAMASEVGYDVLILDLMLPGMNGVEICKKLRKNNIHTPILMLTAKGQVQDKVIGLDAGADDYLVKPFSFEELLARIRALVRRPKKTTDDILKVEDLTLNTKNFDVKKGDKKIILSSREFKLLEYMMRNKGMILSKEKLINHVWDYDTNILPNTIEVYVKNLRKKDIMIDTVRGFGYKIGE